MVLREILNQSDPLSSKTAIFNLFCS